MTLYIVIIKIREMLIDAIDKKDTQLLKEILSTLTILSDIFEVSPDKTIGIVILDMRSAAMDALSGLSWKSDIPTVEDIQKAFEK